MPASTAERSRKHNAKRKALGHKRYMVWLNRDQRKMLVRVMKAMKMRNMSEMTRRLLIDRYYIEFPDEF